MAVTMQATAVAGAIPSMAHHHAMTGNVRIPKKINQAPDRAI